MKTGLDAVRHIPALRPEEVSSKPAEVQQVVDMMIELLLLAPGIDPADAEAAVERWLDQRIAEVSIQRFGTAALYQARAYKKAA